MFDAPALQLSVMAMPQGSFYREFGKKLAEARKNANVTQEALSKALGLSRTSIVNIEKGRQPVQLHLAAKMALSLGTSMLKLVPDPSLTSKPVATEKVSVPNRPWVQRILLGRHFEGENNAAKIFSGEAQGKGVTSSSPHHAGTNTGGTHRARRRR